MLETVRLSDSVAKWFFSLSPEDRVVLDGKKCNEGVSVKENMMVYWYVYLKAFMGASSFDVPRRRRVKRKRVFKPK